MFVVLFVIYLLKLLLLLSFRDRSEKQSNLDASHILTTFAETDFGTCRIPSIQLLVKMSKNKKIHFNFVFLSFFYQKMKHDNEGKYICEAKVLLP